jgi:PAS domain S-box-containing protein
MTTPISSPKIPRYLILLFLLLVLLIGTAAYLYYENQRNHIKKEKESELSSICDLKVKQIVAWKKERLGDAEVLFQNYQLVQQLRKWLKSREKSGEMEEILGWMSSFRGIYDYSSIFLLDEKGNVCLYTSEAIDEVGPYALNFVNEAIQSRKVVWVDLYREEATNHIHLDLLVPLIPRESDGLPSGVLLLRINPYQFLYSYIQSWPTPSRTAESLLVRREGIYVLFLNDLRHRKNTALALRVPITEKQMVAVKAVQGVEGVVEDVDYREVEVLASVRKIPGTSWYLIAKVDQDEIYAPIRKHAALVLAFVVVLILSGGGVIGFLWRNQAARFYRSQYQNEVERQFLLQRYEFLTKYANDIILLTDRNLKIIDANNRAFESYGYHRDELIGMDVRNLRSPEERSLLEGVFKQLDEQKGLFIQTVHQRKDGTRFPIEASLRLIEVEGERFYQSIIRDITRRKQAEAEREKLIGELQEALAQVKTLSGLVPICASCKKIRDDSGYWNQIELYIEKHSTAEFSHSICPECARKLYPQLYDDEKE